MDEWNDAQVMRKVAEEAQTMQATPHEQLIDELRDSTIPKTEREHAAAREIEKNQAKEKYEAGIPACCTLRTAWAHMDELGLCWGLVDALANTTPEIVFNVFAAASLNGREDKDLEEKS